MKYTFSHFSLANKLSLAIVLSVILSVALLGLYFDTYLQESYFKTTKKRLSHGFERLVADISKIEEELKQGIMFIQSDEDILASIELVNNYQDKQNYNAVLLDEEKKSIARHLLDKVKFSLNNDITLYDKNEELIAFATKKEKGYSLCFISYHSGNKILYCKYENEDFYQQNNEANYRHINFRHASYYTQADVINKSTITHHYRDNAIVITSHQSILDQENKISAHIEMSKVLGQSYFNTLSKDLDIAFILENDKKYGSTAFSLLDKESLNNINISQTQEIYYSVASLTTTGSKIFIVASLDKNPLMETLYESRIKLLVILSLFVLFMMLVFRFLFTKGLADSIKQLMQQIAKIEAGDYSQAKLVNTKDELETISKNINQLAMTIKEREADLKKSQDNLEYISYHDVLTDLPNRRLFNSRLEHSLELAKRNNTKLAVLFLDLDQFKHINDTLGHNIGDILLQAVSKRLMHSMRSVDTLARIGGDEFNILIENIRDIRDIEFLVQKLINDFQSPFACGDYAIATTVSIGISVFPEDGQESITLVKNADLAMYKAKDLGRNNYHFFSNSLSEYIQNRAKHISALKHAIASKEEFFLLYQPKFSMQTKKIVAVEALIRWNSSLLGFVGPNEFIPLAEETNLIIPIGDWILQKACSDFIALQKEGYFLEQISINVSGVQLQNSNMFKTLQKTIYETGIKPTQIELEITESYLATNDKKALHTLMQFRDMGVNLAIDDFGTGYSSMSYLQKLPVTRLKIDKSFVDELPDSQESAAIAKAIIALAKTFNLSITAEGVETKKQLEFLDMHGCDEIQGYYYSKPLTLNDLKIFMQKFLIA